MIHTLIFQSLPEQVNVALYGEKAKLVNPWPEIEKVLANTGDHIIWVVTNEQLPFFLTRIGKYDLRKYIVVGHEGENEGTTNRNYPQWPRRLKVFIMKGAK